MRTVSVGEKSSKLRWQHLHTGREYPLGSVLVQPNLEKFFPTEVTVTVEVKLLECSLYLPESLSGGPSGRSGGPGVLRPEAAQQHQAIL